MKTLVINENRCNGENSTHTNPNICQDSRKDNCIHYWERQKGSKVTRLCLKKGIVKNGQ
jgi:hypothetical protein